MAAVVSVACEHLVQVPTFPCASVFQDEESGTAEAQAPGIGTSGCRVASISRLNDVPQFDVGNPVCS
jgi:hypothetical protein